MILILTFFFLNMNKPQSKLLYIKSKICPICIWSLDENIYANIISIWNNYFNYDITHY